MKRSGTFGPAFLAQLNALSTQIKGVEDVRAQLLAAYADGVGVGDGHFEWDDQTGKWTHTPAKPVSP